MLYTSKKFKLFELLFGQKMKKEKYFVPLLRKGDYFDTN